jgi:hypothetical protein
MEMAAEGFTPVTVPDGILGQKGYVTQVLSKYADNRYAEMAAAIGKIEADGDVTPGELMTVQVAATVFEVTSNISKTVADSIKTSEEALSRGG